MLLHPADAHTHEVCDVHPYNFNKLRHKQLSCVQSDNRMSTEDIDNV